MDWGYSNQTGWRWGSDCDPKYDYHISYVLFTSAIRSFSIMSNTLFHGPRNILGESRKICMRKRQANITTWFVYYFLCITFKESSLRVYQGKCNAVGRFPAWPSKVLSASNTFFECLASFFFTNKVRILMTFLQLVIVFSSILKSWFIFWVLYKGC